MIPELGRTSLGFAKFASAAAREEATAQAGEVNAKTFKTELTSALQPVEKMAITPKPTLTKDQFQPLFGKLPYFNTGGLRSKIDNWLQEAQSVTQDVQSLILDFDALAGGAGPLPLASQASLILERQSLDSSSKTLQPKPAESLTERAADSIGEAPLEKISEKPAPEPPIYLGIRQVYHRPFVYTQAFPDILKAEIPALKKVDHHVEPNVMIGPDGEIITATQFDKAGVHLVVNGFWKSVMDRLQPLSTKSPFSHWMSIEDNGRTTLFKRFSFNWVSHYQNTAGQTLTPFALEKLPDGRLVEVLDFNQLPEQVLSQGRLPKLRETLLQQVALIEGKHYTLKSEKSEGKSGDVKPAVLVGLPPLQEALGVQKKGLAAQNPFDTVAFPLKSKPSPAQS